MTSALRHEQGEQTDTTHTHPISAPHHKAILGKKGWSPFVGFLALFQKVHWWRLGKTSQS